MRTTALLSASAILLCLSGCGTIMNCTFDELHKPYGGTVLSAKSSVRNLSGGLESISPTNEHSSCDFGSICMGCLFLVDTPLCVVADTVTLPWMMACALKNTPEPTAANPDLPADVRKPYTPTIIRVSCSIKKRPPKEGASNE